MPCLTFLIGRTRDNTTEMLSRLFLTIPEEQDKPKCQMPAATVSHDTHLPCDNRPQNQVQEALCSQLWQCSRDVVPITQEHILFCKTCQSALRNTPRNKQLKKSFHKSYLKNQSIKEDARKHFKNVVLMHSFNEIRQLFTS